MRKHGTKTTPVFLPANGEAFVAISKFGLLMIRSDSATRKDLFTIGNPPPPRPLIKGGDRTSQKLSHLRGYQRFC